ncbi:MAG: efflux RND transporter permease subunit, partial [Thermotogaceae bacterium]|nr:efflux RND transporter permease subunit [Thermotogaceae bacterium]
MERFVKIFVDRPVTTFIVVLVLIVLGVNALVNMELSMMPDIEYPSVAIMVPAFGMSSKEVEEKVINPIERTVQTIGGVERIESEAYDGYGMVMINFKWEVDVNEVSIDLSEKLNMLSFQLPYNVKPMIFKFSPEMMPVMVIAITGKDWDQISYAAQDIRSALEKLNEVSMIMDMGVRKREIQVYADYRKLMKKGIGMSMIPTAIAAAGSLNSGGILLQGDKYYPVNVDSKLKTLKDLENILLSRGSGFGMMFSGVMGGINLSSFMGPTPNTKLKDVAQVKVGLSNSSMAESRLNGKQAAFLVVQKKSGVNMITASKAVKEVLKGLRLPEGVKVEALMDQSKYMMMSINTLYRNLIIGAIAVVFVLLVFLRDFRVVILVATAIPISLIAGLLLMYFSRMTINIMSLGGLALAVGMLIDNAIVVTESIYRQSEMGVESKKGAYIGAGSVGAAITASTLTTIS